MIGHLLQYENERRSVRNSNDSPVELGCSTRLRVTNRIAQSDIVLLNAIRMRDFSGGWRMHHWQFQDIMPPEELVGKAKEWVGMGAQIVGTCCGMGPEYIHLLSQQIPRK